MRNFIFLFLISVSFITRAQNWKGPNYIIGSAGTGALIGNYFETAVVNGYPAIAYSDETHQNIMFIRALDSNGTNWGIPLIIDTFNISANAVSMKIINGNPAVVYSGGGSSGYSQLRYKRANDINGTTWAAAVIIDPDPIVFSFSLLNVTGAPAIAYSCSNLKKLRFVRAVDANGAQWAAPVLVDSSGYACEYPVLKIANGNPAIGYYNSTNADLMYVRAADPFGSNWGIVDTIQYSGDIGYPFSMEIVNGNPAFAYYYLNSTELQYIRATNTSGSVWGNPVVLDPFTGSKSVSLCIVNGRPAVSFSSAIADDFYYMRAVNANGTAWGTKIPVGDTTQAVTIENQVAFINGKPKIVFRQSNPAGGFYFQSALDGNGNTWAAPYLIHNKGESGSSGSLKIVKGRPALSFYDPEYSTLCYVRAADTSGLIPWQFPLTVDGNAGSGYGNKMEIVDGWPSIAYISYSSNIYRLKFVRAANVTGTSWNTPVLLDSVSNISNFHSFISLAVINDTPAVSYLNPSNSRLMFVRANNPDGTLWGLPVIVDPNGTDGRYNSLAEVNHRPAIAFYDTTNKKLNYVRALNNSGSLWGTTLTLNATGNIGYYASMCVVKGFPAIVANGAFYYHAADSNGTSWNNPVTIGTGGSFNQLDIDAGKPAVAYMSGNYLKYTRAIDDSGTVWEPSDSVYTGSGTYVSHAGTLSKAYITYFNNSEATSLYFLKTLACTPPGAAITPAGPTAFCSGDSVVLNALVVPNRSYQWKKGGVNIPGATNSNYTVTIGGVYRVTVTNMLTGCTRTSAVAITVTVYVLPNATITPQGPTTFCAGDSVMLSANSGAGLTYQWKKDGVNISGAVNINYIADSAGFYKVKVTNVSGCKKISGGVTVSVPCREDESVKTGEGESAFYVNVFPNPSDDDFIFAVENAKEKTTVVRVFDAMGKNIFSEEYLNTPFMIRDSQLPTGVFSAIITNGSDSQILKLVKIKSRYLYSR